MTIKRKFSVGDKVGRLTLIEMTNERIGTKRFWKCKCECGNETIVTTSVIGVTTKSCGCLRKEITSQRFWKGVGDISGSVWNSIRSNAKRRNIDLQITIIEAWDLFLKQNRKCAVTGVPLFFGTDRKRFGFGGNASLDRINNNVGYAKNNTQWVLQDINLMKLDHDMDRFVELCKLVVDQTRN